MFIWDKEIKEINDTTVLFEDWTKGEYTSANLKYLQTEEAKDETELQDITINNITWALLKVFEEHNVTNGLVTKILQTLPVHYNRNVDTALCKKLGVTSLAEIDAFMIKEYTT